MKPGSQTAGVAAMVVATLLWGATFVAIRDALEGVSPYALVAVRFGIAGLLYVPIVWLGRRPVNRAAVEGGLVTGVFTAAGYLFQAIGLVTTTAGSSAFLTSAATLFAAFWAWPILKQRPQPRLVTGIFVALVGAALLSLRAGLRFGEGELWTLLGALAYALQIVLIARYVGRADAAALVMVQSLVVAALVWPFAGDPVHAFVIAGVGTWWRIAYLVVAGSMIAPLLQVLAQRALPPGRIGLLFALEPVFALGFALALGGERFAWRWWAGATLILGAVVLVEWPAARRELREARPR